MNRIYYVATDNTRRRYWISLINPNLLLHVHYKIKFKQVFLPYKLVSDFVDKRSNNPTQSIVIDKSYTPKQVLHLKTILKEGY